jgi:hypothetical protein
MLEAVDVDSEILRQLESPENVRELFEWTRENDPERYHNLVGLFGSWLSAGGFALCGLDKGIE